MYRWMIVFHTWLSELAEAVVAEYLFMRNLSRLGRCRSTNASAGSASRIKYGVVNVVITDTATTMG